MSVEFGDVQALAGMAAAVTAITMGLVYGVGMLINNPRFTVWVKTEIFQIAVSLVLVFLILFLVGLIGLDSEAEFVMRTSWVTDLSGTTSSYLSGSNVFEAGENYLSKLGNFDHLALSGARASMGMYDEFSKYTKQPCQPGWLFCMFGSNGVSIRPLSGAVAPMQVMNLLMYTSTASYLTVLTQAVFLKFIKSGLLAAYLPIAIVLRSLPFMRQFGGGLLAICMSLMIVYPILLFVEAAFWNPEVVLDDYEERVGTVQDITYNELDDRTAYGTASFAYPGEWTYNKTLNALDDVIYLCSAAFIFSTFLFTVNILTISAAARAFGRLLGADVDLSRLMQII